MDYRKLRSVVKHEEIQHPEYIKHKEEFIESMKVLITHYERAIANDVSKTFLEMYEGLTCLLCNPVGLDTCQSALNS